MRFRVMVIAIVVAAVAWLNSTSAEASAAEVASSSCVYSQTASCPAAAAPGAFVGVAGGYYASNSLQVAVTADGHVFGAGSQQAGVGNIRLGAPVVGAATCAPVCNGYWLVAADGGVFSFDQAFYGSLGDLHLDAPIVAIVSGGDGYWLLGADGGTFAFGGVPFTGSFVDAVASDRLQAIGALLNEPPAGEGGGIGLCLAASSGDILCQPVVHP